MQKAVSEIEDKVQTDPWRKMWPQARSPGLLLFVLPPEETWRLVQQPWYQGSPFYCLPEFHFNSNFIFTIQSLCICNHMYNTSGFTLWYKVHGCYPEQRQPLGASMFLGAASFTSCPLQGFTDQELDLLPSAESFSSLLLLPVPVLVRFTFQWDLQNAK